MKKTAQISNMHSDECILNVPGRGKLTSAVSSATNALATGGDASKQ